MMKYLTLGGAGFLGAWTTNRLLTIKSNKVVVFDRADADYSRIFTVHNNVEISKGDFSIYKDFEKLVNGCDVVFHFISTTNPSTADKNIEREITENVLPTIRLLDACVRKKVGKLVFLSSGGTVYGKQADFAPVKESHPTNPITSYGIQKLSLEKYIQLYWHIYKLDYRIIRLSNPFGPYQNPFGGQGVINTFTYRIINNLPINIFGDGKIIRDFIEVRDAIDMIMRIVEKENADKLYNVGSGIGYSINESLSIIENIVGKKAKIVYVNDRTFDVPVNILDISKYLKEISPIRPGDIKIGIKLLVDYYKNLARIN